jgi:hypothetical protein
MVAARCPCVFRHSGSIALAHGSNGLAARARWNIRVMLDAAPPQVLAFRLLRGLWRARKKGDVLDVAPEWLGAPADIAAEAQAFAHLRGCARARPA